jgi:16S rRNA (adenine1518-N6/adenine1519-N6)-dimethyltransferase
MSRMPAPKKSMGQHWLHDTSVCDRIARLCAPTPDTQVFEIGPGAGALTAPLLARGCTVHALEMDRDAITHLESRFTNEISEGRLILTRGDGRDLELPPGDWHIASNLPYNVGTIIFLNLLEQRERIAQMILMFQAEVAQRILGSAGARSQGFLSVLTALEWDASRMMRVRPGAFQPPPKVMSEVIVLNRDLNRPGWPEAREDFRTFVDAAFRTRRKTLRNSLSVSGYEKAVIERVLVEADLAPTIRAEQLEALDLANLFHLFPAQSHGPVRKQR